MIKCLYCGKPLDETDKPGQWHRRCARDFFGRPTVPELEVSNRELEDLAARSVYGGVTVPGVQKKLSVHLSGEDGTGRLTLVGFPAGFILKPPSSEYACLPELEHTTMRMARLVGIHTVPHGLIHLSDGPLGYITRRVDRRRDAPHRIPMEDLCQLSERLTEDKYKGSYERIGRVIARYSSRPGLDLSEYFLVVLFSFITGNADMHLKNFSLYRPGQTWILAPAYDLLPTALVIPDDPEETALTLNGKKRKLTHTDFITFGRTIGVHPKAVERIIEKTVGRVDTLTGEIAQSFLPTDLSGRYQELVRERAGRLG